MRDIRTGLWRVLLVLLGTALPAPAPGIAGESEAPALIEKAEAALARADHRGIARLVAADRAGTFEAVEILLRTTNFDTPGLVDQLARAYQQAFADSFLVERIATFRSWSPDQRVLREQARQDKETARLASNAGRQDEALAGYERVLSIFRELKDLRLEARTLLNQAASLTVKGETRNALAVLDQAQAAGLRTGDQVLLAAVGMNRAYAMEDLGEFAAERAALGETLRLSRSIGDRVGEATVLESLSSLAVNTADYDTAETLSREVARLGAEIPDAGASWAAEINLAAVDSARGDLGKAARRLARAAEFARAGDMPVQQAGAEYNLSNNATKRGDFAEARRLLHSARQLIAGTDDMLRGQIDVAEANLLLEEGRYAETPPFLDSAEAGLAGVEVPAVLSELHQARAVALYYLGDYEGAVTWVRKALQQAMAASRKDMEASCRTNLGRLLAGLGNRTAALDEMEKGERLFDETGDVRGSARTSIAIGAMKWRAGDAEGARTALRRAIDALDRPEMNREKAEAMAHLAEIEMASGPSGRAVGLDLLARSTGTFLASGDLRGVSLTGLVEADAALEAGDLARARAALDRIARVAHGRRIAEFDWEIRYDLGRLAEASGDTARAVAEYQRSVTEVESLRAGVRLPAWRAAIQEDRIEPYRALVKTLRARGEPEKAYMAARAAKARTFAERLVPAGFVSADEDGVSAGFHAGYGDDQRGNGRRQSHAGLLPAPALSTDRLRSLLLPDETLIDFFFVKDELMAFVLRRDGLTPRSIRVPKEFNELLDVARYPGRAEPSDATVTQAWRSAMRKLGAVLMTPLAQDVAASRHLLFVPNGALHGLPFAALEWQQRRLIESWSISILPAAESLLSRRGGATPAASSRPVSIAAARSVTPARILALGDPEGADPTGRLPGAAEEAQAVMRLSGPGGELFIGPGAREALVRQRAAQFDRIHLAAHGRIDRVAPARSYIALSPGDGEDGRLEAGEIADMRIGASLVVLSGCGTGQDAGMARDDPRGDERIGLARAFLSAGAGAVVAGLWEVQDRASTRIMPQLYSRLEGRTVAEAVAQLQRDLIAGRVSDDAGRPLDHPFFWAGLVSYGAGGGTPAATPASPGLVVMGQTSSP
ncbi:MAG TPA: CHAT domain-containing protein [Patescibacteria group bacterium]|nr:CHAT domain-containing protein [Patescibacteria group bacterium]